MVAHSQKELSEADKVREGRIWKILNIGDWSRIWKILGSEGAQEGPMKLKKARDGRSRAGDGVLEAEMVARGSWGPEMEVGLERGERLGFLFYFIFIVLAYWLGRINGPNVRPIYKKIQTLCGRCGCYALELDSLTAQPIFCAHMGASAFAAA